MQINSKVPKWFTGVLIFMNKTDDYFSSIKFKELKEEVDVVFVLRTIVQKKTNSSNLLADKKKSYLVKYFKDFKVYTSEEFLALNSQNKSSINENSKISD